MANKKITELNEASSITSADWLVMVDTGNDETKKIHPDLVGASVPIQDTAPQNPEENDLWIDTSEPEEMEEAIVNEYSESTTDTYSCDYVNEIEETLSSNIKVVNQNVSVNWSGTGYKNGSFSYTPITGYTCINCCAYEVPSGDANGIMFNVYSNGTIYYNAYIGYGNSGTMKVRLLFVKNNLIS